MSLLSARSRESSNQEARHGSKSKPPAAEVGQPNPVWQRIATRIQTKLSVSAPTDPDEREADRIADQVVSRPAPVIQRSCAACAAGDATCPKCEEDMIHRHVHEGADKAGMSVPDGFLSSLSSGQPLDPATRSFMESRFEQNFAGVRIHTDSQAAASARAINALAFTAGPHVVFATGQYSPDSGQGRRLLAHELTHVVQQTGAVTDHISRFRSSDIDKIAPGDASDPTYTFSNKCGWIDWSHVALVDEAQDLITRVENANASLAAASTGGAPATGEVTTPRLESHPSGVVFDSAKMRVKLVRVLSAPEVLAVSLGIWKKLSIAFETNQEWSEFISHSSFSQEDLPSNLIAFYMAKKAKGYTREQIAGPWTGGSQKDTSLIPSFIPHEKKLQWFGRTQKGGFCDALDAKASKAEYDKNPFLGKKSHSFDTPVGATGPWPAELSSIKERDDLYEVLRITLANPSGYANLCPMYRLEGSFFTAAEDVRVVPTYRFKQAPFVLGVPNYVEVEIEPASSKDITAFKSKGYKWPQYVGDDKLVCLSSMGNPI